MKSSWNHAGILPWKRLKGDDTNRGQVEETQGGRRGWGGLAGLVPVVFNMFFLDQWSSSADYLDFCGLVIKNMRVTTTQPPCSQRSVSIWLQHGCNIHICCNLVQAILKPYWPGCNLWSWRLARPPLWHISSPWRGGGVSGNYKWVSITTADGKWVSILYLAVLSGFPYVAHCKF